IVLCLRPQWFVQRTKKRNLDHIVRSYVDTGTQNMSRVPETELPSIILQSNLRASGSGEPKSLNVEGAEKKEYLLARTYCGMQR
ncbi:unnamed protein product, partial [Linum tenue]